MAFRFVLRSHCGASRATTTEVSQANQPNHRHIRTVSWRGGGRRADLGEAREGALDEEACGDHERGDGGHRPCGRFRQRPPLRRRRHPSAPLAAPLRWTTPLPGPAYSLGRRHWAREGRSSAGYSPPSLPPSLWDGMVSVVDLGDGDWDLDFGRREEERKRGVVNADRGVGREVGAVGAGSIGSTKHSSGSRSKLSASIMVSFAVRQ